MNPLFGKPRAAVASPKQASSKSNMKDPYKMTCDEVCTFLDSIGMSAYKKAFHAQAINGEALIELNEADMLALKLSSPAERAKLMMAISQLKSKFVRVNKDDENSSESNSTSGIANTSSPSTNNSSSDQLRFADMASQIDAIRRSQCVATFSLDGTVLDANDVFLNAMGYTLAEVKGKHHRMFVSSEYSASREYAQFWDRLKNNEFHAAEFKRIGKGGREVWLQATYSPILNESGKPWKVVKYATDITASKKRSEIQFKCVYGSETRVIKTDGDISYDKLCSKIRSSFGHRMNIRYTDKAGDVISVKSDEEFLSMLVEYRNESVIRVQLTRRREEPNGGDGNDTAILETMINPVIVINATGIMQFANNATCRMLGYSRIELQGQNVKMLMALASVVERHDGYLSDYLRTGVAHIIGKGRIVDVKRKDGSVLQLDLAVSHTHHRKREIFTGTFSEVRGTTNTSATSTNCSISGLSTGFAMLENLLFSAIVADSKGNILFANGHAARLFGYEKAHLIGKNVRSLMPSPDSEKHDSYMQAYIETRQAKVIGRSRDVVGMMKDGSLVPVNLTISEQVISNQPMFTAILRPLSEDAPRLDSKSVMQAEREMIASLAVPAVMIDERGCIQGFNEAAIQLWGWKITEVVGRNVEMLMPNPERDRHDSYIKRYLETGKQRVFGMGRDVTAAHKDGAVIPVRLSVSGKKDGDKRLFTAIVQKLN